MHNQIVSDKSKLTRIEIFFLLLSATVTITLVSANSPLYPFNPWDDINVFFTMGRAIKHGLVPYKDIFDHKGPLLYFIYAIATLISEKSFIGVWIIECIAASVYAIFSWKIAKLFTTPSKFAIMVVPVFLGIVYTIKMFNFGGNTEELCFPLLTIALYLGLRAIVNGDGIPGKIESIICGLIAGALFWLKYTFLGFIIGFCIYILLLSIKRKSFIRLWSLVWRFIVGFTIVSIPILVYFLATNSLDYLWDAYFYTNIFLYNSEVQANWLANIPVLKYVLIPLNGLCVTNAGFPAFGVMLMTSLISLLFIDKEHRKKTICLFFITFVCSAGFIFTRISFIFYYGYLLCYSFAFVLISLVKCWNLIEKVFKQNKSFIRILLSVVFVIFYGVSIFLCKNMYLIFQPKTFLAQFKMAETINQTPDAKLLTYDVMDAGFYTAAGIMPCNRYCADKQFEEDAYPQLREEQNRLIGQGYFDYIVTSYFCEAEWDNYELIQEEAIPYVDFTGKQILDGYKLYKKIG